MSRINIGTSTAGQVVLKVDENSPVLFSPAQARSLAVALVRKAKEAEGEQDQPLPPADLDSVTTDDLVKEVARRSDAMIAAFLFKGVPQPLVPRFFANGGVCSCLGLASKLHEYVDKLMPVDPHQPRMVEPT